MQIAHQAPTICDNRQNVDWLSDDKCIKLKESPKSALEEIVIHLNYAYYFVFPKVITPYVGDIHFSDDPYKLLTSYTDGPIYRTNEW